MSSKLERDLQEISRELINWQSVGKEKVAEEIRQFHDVMRPEMIPSGLVTWGRIDLNTLALHPSSPKKEIIAALSTQEVSLSFQLGVYSVDSCLYVADRVTAARIHICGSRNHETEFVKLENTPLGRSIPTTYTPFEKFRTARRLISFLQRDFRVGAFLERPSA